ncbi:MAG: FecR family protein, partial [Steroidobacteraceae bacterium]
MTTIPRKADVHSTAASWDARLRSHRCTDDDRAAFRVWCEADPRHQGAVDRLQQALATLRQAGEHPQVRALREVASVADKRTADRRRLWGAALAAGVLAAAAALTVTRVQQWEPPVTAATTSIGVPVNMALSPGGGFASALNERRTIALRDGSSVTLNAATHIDTEWLPKERRIRLLSGQAVFRVAKDPTRPFIVTVGDRTVTALGTAFDIKLDADKVQVTLMEGRVVIGGLGKAAAQPTLELTPNEQLVATAGEAPKVRRVDIASATGWAEGQVYFTDETLSAAVAEMNQYSAEQITLGDPTLRDYRVNGMFRAGNQDGFAGALADYYPID